MTDRAPITEAGRRFVAAYTLPEELGAVLAIEDEARAPLVAALEVLNANATKYREHAEATAISAEDWRFSNGYTLALKDLRTALSREDRP